MKFRKSLETNLDSNKDSNFISNVLAEDKELTVGDFFKKYYPDKHKFNIDREIAEVLDAVNFKKAALDKKISAFSG